jgi:hypothetical protein
MKIYFFKYIFKREHKVPDSAFRKRITVLQSGSRTSELTPRIIAKKDEMESRRRTPTCRKNFHG